MTSRFSAASDLYESAANDEASTSARIADEGPYARPVSIPPHRAVDAVLIDAIRASVGPFVPAPWRTVSATSTAASPATAASFQSPSAESPADVSTAVASTPDEFTTEESPALPWIESFLDTAEVDVDATDEPSFPEEGSAIESVSHATGLPVTESEVVADSAPSVAEEWPIENEDMMDIMPVQTPVAAADGNEHWAARARRETSGEGSPESAAQALEALAQRVRCGEIQLPAFSAGTGEAAMLAAALAALLSVQR